MNIVIPMAGRGSRFEKAGFSLPKPLLSVLGRPMIEVVVENLRPTEAHRFIFICQEEHLSRFELRAVLDRCSPGSLIVPITYTTEGAACTVLLAREWIDSNEPLMIANCDQYVSTPIDAYLQQMAAGAFDGYIMTMTATDPKWSFVGLGPNGEVTQVVEKRAISSEATVGIYNYRNGCDFVRAADAMIAAGDRTNNEFYVAPAYNYMIRAGARVGIMNVGSERNGMFGLGVPEDLEYFNSLSTLPGI